jgi:hypothetical protein
MLLKNGNCLEDQRSSQPRRSQQAVLPLVDRVEMREEIQSNYSDCQLEVKLRPYLQIAEVIQLSSVFLSL